MPIREDLQPGESCWAAPVGHDIEAAARLYSDLFGWTTQGRPGRSRS